MERKKYYGAVPNKDLDPDLLRRDIRPLRYKIKDFISSYGGWSVVILGIMAGILPFTPSLPQISDFVLIFGILFYFFVRNKIRTYTFRKPLTPDMPKKEAKDAGIMILGNELETNSGVWFSNDDLRTHMLLFGSTGCGKSRTLLSLMYQTLVFGSGLMYVDGKADNTVAWLMYSIARRLGREDDFLIVNYLTGQNNSANKEISLNRLSNTTNPFSFGDSESLRSLVVGLMRGGDGGDMWKGRASAMIGALLKALVFLRDRGDIVLDVSKIREFLPLEKCIELVFEYDIPVGAIDPLRKYLLELPGYSDEDAQAGTIQAKAFEQHGYIIMQFSEVMSNLSDTYGHIFSAPLGETDFIDVVFNRRILFVMLPSIGVDPDSLAGLGKLIIASVRSALAPALGNKVEGSKVEVIDTKPTNSKVPFMLCLDEYGYYAVQGFAVVAAQARSLGVSVIFAGQDYPSFKKADQIEAQATVANTNVKVCMKLEDAEETYNVMKARAGQANQTVSGGYEVKGTLGYHDQLQARTEKVERLAIEDLVEQDAGYGFVIWRSHVRPIKMFFADPHEVEDAELNKFIMVRQPKKNVVKKLLGGEKKLKELFGITPTDNNELITISTDKGIVDFLEDFKALRARNEASNESAIASIGMIAYKVEEKDKEFKRKVGFVEESKVEDSEGLVDVNDVQKPVINVEKHRAEEKENIDNEMGQLAELAQSHSADVDDLAEAALMDMDSDISDFDNINLSETNSLDDYEEDDFVPAIPGLSGVYDLSEIEVDEQESEPSKPEFSKEVASKDVELVDIAKAASERFSELFDVATTEVTSPGEDATPADMIAVCAQTQIDRINDLTKATEEEAISKSISLERESMYSQHPLEEKSSMSGIEDILNKVRKKLEDQK